MAQPTNLGNANLPAPIFNSGWSLLLGDSSFFTERRLSPTLSAGCILPGVGSFGSRRSCYEIGLTRFRSIFTDSLHRDLPTESDKLSPRRMCC